MRARITVCCSAALVLAACGSAPTIPTPDGRQRQPVNTQAAIDAHEARIADEEASYGARSAFARRLDALHMDVASLKSAIESLAPATNAAIRAARAPARGHEPQRSSGKPVVSTVLPPEPVGGESIELRPRSITFRLMHAVADTRFVPSTALSVPLLRAARQARHIEVRGRTDGETASDANRVAASARANAARAYLVAHGVDPARIRTSSLAAGGHAADNTTAAGRALNRRVEIDVMDLDTATYTSILPPTSGASQ